MDVIALDRQIFEAINHTLHGYSGVLDPLMGALTSLGLGHIQVLLLLVISFFWRRFGRHLAIPGILAFAISGIGVQIIKHLIPRDRPGKLYPQFLAADEQIFSRSFPSGHTITSFAIAYVFWFYGRRAGKPWIGWAGGTFACLTGLSRIYRGVHWPGDVFTSAILGLLTGYFVCRWYQKYLKEAQTDPVTAAQVEPIEDTREPVLANKQK